MARLGTDSRARLAHAAAAACGVTRLGDITHLDCLGVPVFQAVRPWSRALSVHQGKGLTPPEAELGALMEAVESAHAEAFAGEVRRGAWADLPVHERAPRLDDFARRRGVAPADDEVLAWTPARKILGGGVLWAPFDAVSLDFSRPVDSRLSQTSNGQAAHFEREAATVSALLEVIERDAVAAWFDGSPTARSRNIVARGSIPYAWWQDLQATIDRAGMRVTVHELPALGGYPTFLTELKGELSEARGPIVFYGSACAPSAERALEGSVLEAVQSRVTEIAGARDDILYRTPGCDVGMGLAWPAPPGMPLRRWADILERAQGRDTSGAVDIARRLADAGYPQAAVIELNEPGADVVVIKAFVPGLGANRRLRRRPEPRH
ncbi:YcaO-like family protein [Phenylobacterium sp.]|uniref:YcaO-like family protein n=1 Tax=Phenylobacterium sp. TaxID=1871053 RepID=UPI002EDAAD7F